MKREWQPDRKISGLGLMILPSGVRTYYLRYREPSGKQQTHKIGRAEVVSLTMARDAAVQILAAVAKGEAPTTARKQRRHAPTMAELHVRMTREHYATLRPGTARNYEQIWRLHVLPAIGSKRVADVTRSDVIAVLAPIPGVHRNRVLQCLKAAFNMAEVWELCPAGANPCRKVPRVAERVHERYLSRDEFERLTTALDTFAAAGVRWRFAQLVRLLLLTGCRVGEICRARWEWLDQDAALLRIPADHHKTGNDGHQRIVHLPPAALTILGELRGETTGPWIIAGRRGHHLIGYQKLWVELLAAARITNLTVHDLRHNFASVALTRSGLTLPQVGALLGHASPQTTARYAHLVDEAAAAMAAKVALAISPVTGAR